MSKHMRAILGICVCAIVTGAAMFVAALPQAGSLEPPDAPAPTMKTLDQIPPTWSFKIEGAERFELVLDGEGILDRETGLVWEQSPSTSAFTWTQAHLLCFNLFKGGRKGWHLPTVEQLMSLVVPGPQGLPSEHPFTDVQSGVYWSGSTSHFGPYHAMCANLANASACFQDKAVQHFAWCVRGGQSHNVFWYPPSP